MRRLAALAVVAWSVVAPSRSLAWSHGWHRGPRVFVGVWGPSPPVWPPYYAPYPVHSYPPPPPPDDPG